VQRIIRVISSVVRRAPRIVIGVAIGLTLLFGALTGQQEQASGNEGFSPDSEEFLAAQTIDDVFTSSSEVAVQVLFSSQSDDLLTADGLRTYSAVRRAILDSRASEIMGHRDDGNPEGDIEGFLETVLDNAEAQGIDINTIDDPSAKALIAETLATMPPDAIDSFLFSSNADKAAMTSPSGLMVVFLALSKLPDDPNQVELQAIEVDMQQAIREAASLSEDVTAEPFSFALLFANQGEFTSEIGRLFAAAGFIILIILASVFLILPEKRSMVALAFGGFTLLAIITALMVLEVLPIWAPLAAIILIFGLWSNRDKGLRRSVADTMLAFVVIMMSITWMNGIGVLLGPKYLGIIGKFSEILQIVPILLIGLGVDYAIHLTSRYREEMGSGSDVITSATRASATVGVALVLATVTTAVGFLTNIFNPVTAIADFGILATVGITAAFLLMLTFVPAARILLDSRAERRGEHPIGEQHDVEDRMLPRLMGSLSVFAERVPALTLSVALVAGGLGAWGLTNLDTTFSFTDFVPQGSELLVTFEEIQEEFGGGFGERTQVLIEGSSLATVDMHNALMESHDNMLDTTNVVVLDGRAQATSPLSVIDSLARPAEFGGDPETFSPEFLQTALALGLQPDGTVPPGTDVVALWGAAEQAAPEDWRMVAAAENDLIRYINVSVGTQAGEQGAPQLAEDLTNAFMPVTDVAGVTAVPTNENIISVGVIDALQASQVSSIILTILAAMALLVINFTVESRRPLLGVITILPVALVVLWVFGAMALTGISFNPVTAMIAAIAIGIGVPYTIHITHRYQEDRIRYETPEEAIKSTMTHTGGALAGSAFTTVAGFGILVTSTLTPFQQFGLVVGYAIGFALIAAVMVLPSMLILWDRWHRRRGDAVLDASRLLEGIASGAAD